MIQDVQPHNATAESAIEIEGTEIDVLLELEYVPENRPPKDYLGNHIEPYEPGGYIIQGAQWRNPFDKPAEWEPVPGILMDIIHKNEREMLERAGVEVKE